MSSGVMVLSLGESMDSYAIAATELRQAAIRAMRSNATPTILRCGTDRV